MEFSTLAQASAALVSALSEHRPGHVARIALQPQQVALAMQAADLRRACARIAMQRGARDYAAAAAAPEPGTYAAGRLCTDRRGVLAEMVIGDLLALSGDEFDMQPLVSHRSEPGADVRYGGRTYDIKAAGQLSSQWSMGPSQGRLSDDRLVTIAASEHARYGDDPEFAGYLLVYLYVRDDAPYAADIFYVAHADVSALKPSPGRAPMGPYYSVRPPFPDDLHSADYGERLASVTRAGYAPALAA